MKKEWTIQIDNREKKPLPIPANLCFLHPDEPPWRRIETTLRLHTTSVKMPTGDYCLAGHSDICLIERKGSLREVAGYCVTKSGLGRFESQLSRMREASAYPVILLEGRLGGCESGYTAGLDSFLRLVAFYRMPLLCYPASTLTQRHTLGELIARYLLNTVIGATENVQPLAPPQIPVPPLPGEAEGSG